MSQTVVVTQRDCPARLVPVGDPITIPKDSFITVTQALGGNYTVVVNGNMARVDGTDADALGFEPEVIDYPPADSDTVREEDVWTTLRSIYDPEIPVNIVDLGLIYRCEITGNDIHIDMTLTAPGCGMGPVLVDDIRYRMARVPNAGSCNVDLVFDPPWDRNMMSEEAQLELGLF